MAAGKPTSYTMNRRLAAAKSKEFSIVDKFALGYRNREDVTTLPPGVLIEGSQNVLTNTFQRVGVRKGYTLDGAANTDDAPIGGGGTGMGVFDWVTSFGDERNMRAGFLTSAANDGKLQYRHIKSDGSIEWLDLLTSLTSVNFNFITYFDTSQLQTVTVMVNGESNTRVWNGAVDEVASTTSTTITLAGSQSAEGRGFSATGGLVINGVEYAYTGIGDTPNSVYSHSDTTLTPAINTGTWHSQLFTTSGAGTAILSATIRVKSLTSPNNVNAVFNGYIYTDNAGVPGTNLGATTATIVHDFSPGDFDLTFNFTGVAATPATNYHFVIQYVSGASTSSFDIYTGNSGSVGTNISIDSGVSWTAENGYMYATVYENTGALNKFFGVSPDPSAVSVGATVAQAVVTYTNAGGNAGLPVNFANQFLGTIYGLIFVGSSSESYVYISSGNPNALYTQWTGNLVLGVSPTAFINQEAQLYISAGTNQWFVIERITSATLIHSFTINPINFSALQASQSQALTTKISNSIAFVSFEPALETFGPVQNIYQSPQTTDLSQPIVNLMNDYDFTGGSAAYFRKFIYIAVPQENVVLVYNMTNSKNPYWEAPQVLPIARFSIIGGELYGHSSQVSETYKLFTGYADRATSTSAGLPITADWVFSYENYGSRFSFKKATKMFVEGYISAGDTLTAILTYELDACKTVKTFTLDGDDDQFVCISGAEGSLGKESLGKIKLGGDAGMSINGLPPKFRWFPTFSNTDFFEVSPSFSALVSGPLDILAFGLATGGSSEIPVQNYD